MEQDDFSVLKNMKYSGRRITLGVTPNGDSFVAYSLTGRSTSSQARRLVEVEEGRVVTMPTNEDEIRKGNTALLLYPAVVRVGDILIASNGAQTKFIEEMAKTHQDIRVDSLLRKTFNPDASYMIDGIDVNCYEPDAPNNTPRISGVVKGPNVEFYIVRTQKPGSVEKHANFYFTKLKPGQAKAVTTYAGGNENPLLPFTDTPNDWPMNVTVGSTKPEDIARVVYDSVKGGEKPSDDFRVAVAVLMMNHKTGGLERCIINRHDKTTY